MCTSSDGDFILPFLTVFLVKKLYFFVNAVKGTFIQSQKLPLSLSLCILFIAPSFHPHIKARYQQDQTRCVRASDRLIYWWLSSMSVSFMIGVEGQGHRDTFLTRSVFDYWCFYNFSCLRAQLDLRELQGHMLMPLLT